MSKHKKKYDLLVSIPVFFSAFLFLFSGPVISETSPQNQRALCQSVIHCKTKQCILGHGFVPIRHFFSGSPAKYIEVYEQLGKRNIGYNARMVGHGLLCIATAGLWEIAYYPIEKSLSDIIVVEATYPNVASHRIEKIRVYQSY